MQLIKSKLQSYYNPRGDDSDVDFTKLGYVHCMAVILVFTALAKIPTKSKVTALQDYDGEEGIHRWNEHRQGLPEWCMLHHPCGPVLANWGGYIDLSDLFTWGIRKEWKYSLIGEFTLALINYTVWTKLGITKALKFRIFQQDILIKRNNRIIKKLKRKQVLRDAFTALYVKDCTPMIRSEVYNEVLAEKAWSWDEVLTEYE